YQLGPFANMLDAGGATAAAYHLPRNRNFQLVVIDGSGKIAYSAGSILSYTGNPAESRIHGDLIEKCLKEYPNGILGEAAIPPAMAQAAHFFDLQQFDLMEKELAHGLEGAGDSDARFAAFLRSKVADIR